MAVLELLDVGLRATARGGRDAHVGVVGRMLRDDGTEGVVGTGLAAGHEAQATAVVGAGAAARAAAAAADQGEGKRQGQGDDARD